MNNATQPLIDALDCLCSALTASRKLDTAAFFSDLKRRVQEARDKDSLVAVTGELRRLGAIAQYAEFSSREERLLSDVHQAALLLEQEQ